MTRKLAERGEGRLGCIIWLLVLGLVILIFWKTVPVKIASAQFYDYIDEQAKFAQYTSAERLKKRILRRAEELDIPVNEKNLIVQRPGDRVRIKVSYTVPVEFPGYTYMWHFDHEVDEPIFIW